ncbi:solute carrier family 15 member 1-like [Centruroides sculpturatus]|uniref:solute carrier family 15 member 1-like n=1 Tax=Centruroides sculpturatus TaxID=218467 RepID=UPI000C6E4F3B|nr:solute carrier family 15 member 1-like [Centruroides sculpturatus]
MKFKLRNKIRKKHWLDYADDKYEKCVISDVKDLISDLFLLLPLPVFWSLFFQMGSSWTLQANKMNQNVLGFDIKPDQMQALDPIMFIIFTPIFDYLLYPALSKVNLLTKPLHRMVIGGLFASMAFIIAGFLQLSIESNLSSHIHLKIINESPCEISLKVQSLSSNITFQVDNNSITETDVQNLHLSSLHLTSCKISKPFIYFINMETNETLDLPEYNNTFSLETVGRNRTVLYLKQWNGIENLRNIKFITENGINYEVEITIHSNSNLSLSFTKVNSQISFSILLQVPQYFLMSIGEIMFSVTGASYFYCQAPKSMKSVIQALWMLTPTCGNLLVMIITEIKIFGKQSYEFFLYAVLMAIAMLIFFIMMYCSKGTKHVRRNSEFQRVKSEIVKLSLKTTES